LYALAHVVEVDGGGEGGGFVPETWAREGLIVSVKINRIPAARVKLRLEGLRIFPPTLSLMFQNDRDKLLILG
jgi:hypothetical protein